MFNFMISRALEERRNLDISSARSVKMANEKLGKLQPSEKLFGGKARQLSKSMKDESELRGRGGSDPKKFFGQYGNQYSGNKGGGFCGSACGGGGFKQQT